jgi:hypothetical protein
MCIAIDRVLNQLAAASVKLAPQDLQRSSPDT